MTNETKGAIIAAVVATATAVAKALLDGDDKKQQLKSAPSNSNSISNL